MRASVSVEQITTFLKGIAGSRGLRAVLVSDETAGSPLVDELLGREVDPGVMIIRARFSPEPMISLPPLFAGSLCDRLMAIEGIREPQMALRWLAIAVRRFSRLHPILLVIEDLDVVGSVPPAELALFLASLCDETLSVLCHCRTVDPAIRCVVERYLVEAIRLDDAAAPQVDVSAGSDGSPAVEISMIGEITLRRGDARPIPVRGVRHSTVLGILVIDRMLGQPLSYREFCRLASGGIDDPVRAQKIMNMGVKRLQEMLGPEAITREAVTPRLNLDRVSVDLLRAHSLLRESVVNARTGPLMRAVDQLGAALDIAAGKPLFPGLDGEMFIAAREDFIGTLRSAVVEVARMMVEEGEGAGVEPVLRRVLELFPDDAEIVGLLGERYDPDSDDLFPSHPASRSTVMQTETFLFATMPAAARSYRPGAA